MGYFIAPPRNAGIVSGLWSIMRYCTQCSCKESVVCNAPDMSAHNTGRHLQVLLQAGRRPCQRWQSSPHRERCWVVQRSPAP